MTRPRALDLFCGAGGASMGLHRAGFDVIGVDIEPQPHYPFSFIRGDALAPPVRLEDFDFVWASPVCKAYGCLWTPKEHPRLIEPVREMLERSAALYTIENVPGAPLRRPVVLDGTMFPGLRVIRRRLFECSFPVPLALGFDARGMVKSGGWSTVVGGGRCSGVPASQNRFHTAEAKRAAMGIDWMNRDELAQAIPPAFAEFIGRAAIEELTRRRVGLVETAGRSAKKFLPGRGLCLGDPRNATACVRSQALGGARSTPLYGYVPQS